MGGAASSRRRAASEGVPVAEARALAVAPQGRVVSAAQSPRAPVLELMVTRLVCHTCERAFAAPVLSSNAAPQCPACGGFFIEYQVWIFV